MPVGGVTFIYPHTFAVTQFRPAGFIASPLDAGLLRQRCSAANRLPCGVGFRLDCGLGFAIGVGRFPELAWGDNGVGRLG